MLNRVQIIGNLGRDPETRYTQGGSPVTSFSVACTEKWKDKQSGERRERTEWVNVTAFGRQAEVCGQYLSKGSKVYVEGRMQTDSYEKDGIKRYSTKVILQHLVMLGGKPQENSSRDPGPAPTGGVMSGEDDLDENIPFAWLLPLPFAPALLEVANAAKTVL